MIKFYFSIYFALFMSFFYQVSATSYYVSHSSTSTNWAAAKNINSPCNAQTAFDNAKAGDTVQFRGGKYTIPANTSGTWLTGYYAPNYSGTEDAPIVFMAYPGETPIFDGTSGGIDKDGHGYYHHARIMSNARYTSKGTNFHEYITFDGFTFQCDGGVNEARIALTRGDNGYKGQRGRGIVIKNCIFNGGTNINPPHSEGGTGDNREGLFISQLTGVIVSNCIFFNYNHKTNDHNTSAIKTYHSDNVSVENCEIYNSTLGIFYKSNTDDSKIRYNYIHNCNVGVEVGAFGWWNDQNDHSKGYFVSESNNLEIYHNVFFNQVRGNIGISNEDGGNSDGMKIFNNTFCTTNEKGINIGMSSGKGQEFYNNIIYGLWKDNDLGLLRWFCKDNNEERVAAGVKVELEIKSADHNQFGDFANNFLIRVYRPNSSFVSYNTLAAWQGSKELINNGHPGEGDITSNPLFVNASGSMNQISDFALQVNSPCKATGRNGEDMGANISLVGIQGALSADVTPPTAPTNLTGSATSQTEINLTWTKSTDAVGYRIYRNDDKIGTSVTASYSDKGLKASTKYAYRVAAYDAAGNVSDKSTAVDVTTLAEVKTSTPDLSNSDETHGYSLSQNSPNPFKHFTQIEFELENAAFVTLKIYDISGREIASLINGIKPSGKHTVQWNGTSSNRAQVGDGVYFYQLKAGASAGSATGWVDTKKMILSK